ncbi:hypothetical protein HKX48_005227 [Thoreauomyces humboldtii]|nr:hypothetical protein HKX48_005227 [Thoreauomyces humboldtii]
MPNQSSQEMTPPLETPPPTYTRAPPTPQHLWVALTHSSVEQEAQELTRLRAELTQVRAEQTQDRAEQTQDRAELTQVRAEQTQDRAELTRVSARLTRVCARSTERRHRITHLVTTNADQLQQIDDQNIRLAAFRKLVRRFSFWLLKMGHGFKILKCPVCGTEVTSNGKRFRDWKAVWNHLKATQGHETACLKFTDELAAWGGFVEADWLAVGIDFGGRITVPQVSDSEESDDADPSGSANASDLDDEVESLDERLRQL